MVKLFFLSMVDLLFLSIVVLSMKLFFLSLVSHSQGNMEAER